MRLNRSDVQITVEISNAYDKLIPIGTLVYYGVPTSNFALQGINVNRSSWSALDAWFLNDVFGSKSIHESMQALLFLLRHRYLAATFKVYSLSVATNSLPFTRCFWKVRIYAIPLDIEGARFLRLWRRSWLTNYSTLSKRAKAFWGVLLTYVDFSSSGWFRFLQPLTKSTKATIIGIPFYAPVGASKRKSGPSYYHMQRWLKRESFGFIYQDQMSLESIVKDIYSGIETPDLTHYQGCKPSRISGIASPEEAISLLLQQYMAGTTSIRGLKSHLYLFQLRSVCKMYEKESISRRTNVPHFIEFESPTGSTYYYDTLSFGFYVHPELYTVPKGGILAENMGLGKTLICLSLICFTKHEMASIPDDFMVKFSQKPSKLQLRRLTDVCISEISQNSLPWKYYLDDLPPSLVEKLSRAPGQFFIASDQIQANLGLRGRPQDENKDRWLPLLVSSLTLVVVPENLLHQWNDEAKKHLEGDFLKRLFISDRFKQRIHFENADYVSSPPEDPTVLTMYDLIVISLALFSKMTSNDNNVFRKIYWKRLIIDEGHTMSSRSSNLSANCKLLHCERRWVVTGTPTSGLTNLHMDEDSADVTTESPKKKRKYVVKNKFNVRDDLAKLGNLVSHYFKIEPFHSQPGLWASSITKSLLGLNQLTASISLQNLLNSLMVRHNQAQVEADLVLPQLHHEVVFLEPSYQNKLAINLFTSVLAVNAVSSERVGGDYMFDSSNRQELQRLVGNLQLSTFYWTGFKVLDVRSLADIVTHCLEKQDANGGAYYGDRDQALLRKSLLSINRALCNPRWRAASSLHEMQIYVSGLPRPYITNFAKGTLRDVGVYGAPQLAAVQKFFYKNRFLDQNHTLELCARLQESSKEFWKNYWLHAAKNEKGRFTKNDTSVQFETLKIREEGEDHYLGHEKRTVLERFDDIETPVNKCSLEKENDQTSVDVKTAQVLGTASTKLSYLASKLVGHQTEGIKSIVFFEYEDSAYYLTELLEILGVQYILYATFIKADKRPNNLHDFASYDSKAKGGITLIMDLKLASHGLTVISATHVYFINPVWLRAVEAQAIKRAHRIGQTREVYVETLVLKGTLEEEIYRRRLSENTDESIQDDDSAQKKYVIDDTGMQNFVLRHEFLSIGDNENEYADFSEFLHTSHPSEARDLADSDLEFSLPSHSFSITDENGNHMRKWTMRLFSRENLQKFVDSKHENPSLSQLNVEFVEGKDCGDATDTAQQGDNTRRSHNPLKDRGTPRKRVRF